MGEREKAFCVDVGSETGRGLRKSVFVDWCFDHCATSNSFLPHPPSRPFSLSLSDVLFLFRSDWVLECGFLEEVSSDDVARGCVMYGVCVVVSELGEALGGGLREYAKRELQKTGFDEEYWEEVSRLATSHIGA